LQKWPNWVLSLGRKFRNFTEHCIALSIKHFSDLKLFFLKKSFFSSNALVITNWTWSVFDAEDRIEKKNVSLLTLKDLWTNPRIERRHSYNVVLKMSEKERSLFCSLKKKLNTHFAFWDFCFEPHGDRFKVEEMCAEYFVPQLRYWFKSEHYLTSEMSGNILCSSRLQIIDLTLQSYKIV
jgi:hypothetical protein